MAITVPAYMAQKQLPASMGTASALSKTMIIILVCVRFPLLFLFTVKFSKSQFTSRIHVPGSPKSHISIIILS